MTFTLVSKYDVGNTLLTCPDKQVTVKRVRLKIINNNCFVFEYLVENDDNERIWLAESNLRRLDSEPTSHSQTAECEYKYHTD